MKTGQQRSKSFTKEDCKPQSAQNDTFGSNPLSRRDPAGLLDDFSTQCFRSWEEEPFQVRSPGFAWEQNKRYYGFKTMNYF